MVDLDDLLEPGPGMVRFTTEAFEIARHIAIRGWNARRAENFLPPTDDLTGSCKFGSLFLRALFGGEIKGSADHQYVVLDGEILDFSRDATDVRDLADPYRHDPAWFRDGDLLESLESCLPRVEGWIEQFAQHYSERRNEPMNLEEQRDTLEAQLDVLKFRLGVVGIEKVEIEIGPDGNGDMAMSHISAPGLDERTLDNLMCREVPIIPATCGFDCQIDFSEPFQKLDLYTFVRRVAVNLARYALQETGEQGPGIIDITMGDGNGEAVVEGMSVHAGRYLEETATCETRMDL